MNKAQQLKELIVQKKILSKKVGISIKTGLDPSASITKVKELSIQIKEIEQQIKQQEKPNDISNDINSVIPSQFKENVISNKETQITVTNQFNAKTWDAYVKQHPNSTIYHTSQIKKTIEETFSHTCYYLIAIDKNHEIQGVLPLVSLKSYLFGNLLISVPFFNYGGLLYSNLIAKEQLLNQAHLLLQQTQHESIEYRDCYKSKNMPSKTDKVTMLLTLPNSYEHLWQQIGSKVRAQIKKSEQNQLKFKYGKEELLKDFYSVFSKNMRDLGTPVYSINFFQNMLKYNETAQICILYHLDKPISCGFLIGWRETMEIPWASTIKEANKLNANMKLYWEVLKLSINQGYTVFDFGRSSSEGATFKFKKQWGATPYPLFWNYQLEGGKELPKINPKNPKFQLLISIWKKLPIWLANIIGPPIIKNIP